MINFDDARKEYIKKHNPNCPQIPDHPCRILIIGGSGSGKANLLFNLINQQPDILHTIMKIPNKRKIQRIAFNHSSAIDFKDFMNLYKTCSGKPYSYLVVDSALASDNRSLFRKNLFLKK